MSKWELLDDDCMQYRKWDGFLFDFIQIELTSKDKYAVISNIVDTRDITYSDKSDLRNIYGLEDENIDDIPKWYFAEMYFETYCRDSCTIHAIFDDFKQAEAFILDYIKNN